MNWPEFSGVFPTENDEIEIKQGQKFIVTADQLVCYKKITVFGILLIDPTKGENENITFCAQIM